MLHTDLMRAMAALDDAMEAVMDERMAAPLPVPLTTLLWVCRGHIAKAQQELRDAQWAAGEAERVRAGGGSLRPFIPPSEGQDGRRPDTYDGDGDPLARYDMTWGGP